MLLDESDDRECTMNDKKNEIWRSIAFVFHDACNKEREQKEEGEIIEEEEEFGSLSGSKPAQESLQLASLSNTNFKVDSSGKVIEKRSSPTTISAELTSFTSSSSSLLASAASKKFQPHVIGCHISPHRTSHGHDEDNCHLSFHTNNISQGNYKSKASALCISTHEEEQQQQEELGHQMNKTLYSILYWELHPNVKASSNQESLIHFANEMISKHGQSIIDAITSQIHLILMKDFLYGLEDSLAITNEFEMYFNKNLEKHHKTCDSS